MLLPLFIVVFLPCSDLHASGGMGRGINVQLKVPGGRAVNLYNNSYALLIGVSDYTGGWPDLESVPEEVDNLEQLLKLKGFFVKRVDNPDAIELKAAFDDFVNLYGYDTKNRLLFYYSGHGYSIKSSDNGYLVPSDAPDPNIDKKNFLRKSLNMTKLLSLSREMIANHALFLFDSCFSGTIFKTRSLPSIPPIVKISITRPVRQFITSGSAGEEVPAKSVFAKILIDGLKGEADLNHDGYILGSELGMFLASSVPVYAMQTPQYGKINEYDLSRGDFVFRSDLNITQRTDAGVLKQRKTKSVAPKSLNKEVLSINRSEEKYDLHIVPRKIGLYNNYLAIGSGQHFTRLYNLRTLRFEDDKLPYFSYSNLKQSWKNYSLHVKAGNKNILEISEYGELKRHIKVSQKAWGKILVFSFSEFGNILVGTDTGYFLIFNRLAKLRRKIKLEKSPVQDMAVFHNIITVALETRHIYVWRNLEDSREITEELMLISP